MVIRKRQKFSSIMIQNIADIKIESDSTDISETKNTKNLTVFCE